MWLIQRSVWKSRCNWSTRSAASWESYSIFTCELVWKFQAWIWCEIFHTWKRCEFSIRHVQICSTCEILNLHTFQTCFWCESGIKQAWSYEDILYGIAYINRLFFPYYIYLYAPNTVDLCHARFYLYRLCRAVMNWKQVIHSKSCALHRSDMLTDDGLCYKVLYNHGIWKKCLVM